MHDDSVHPENYRREEDRILGCISAKHNANFIKLPSVNRWWE